MWSTHWPIVLSFLSNTICHLVRTAFSSPETSWPSGQYLFLLPPWDSWGNVHFFRVHSFKSLLVRLGDKRFFRIFSFLLAEGGGMLAVEEWGGGDVYSPVFVVGGTLQSLWVVSRLIPSYKVIQKIPHCLRVPAGSQKRLPPAPGCSLFIIDNCPHVGASCPGKLYRSWSSRSLLL